MFTNMGNGSLDRIESSTASSLYTYHVICWGVPLLSVIAMLYFGRVGAIEGIGNASCWLILDSYEDGVSLISVAISFVLILPLAVVEIYNVTVFRFFARTLQHIPSSGRLLDRFKR